MNVAAGICTYLGIALLLVSVLGVLVMRGVYDRLHYLGPATLGAILIMAGIWAEEGPSLIGIKAALLAAFILATSPVLVHVTGRAAREAEHDGAWEIQPGEPIEVEPR